MSNLVRVPLGFNAEAAAGAEGKIAIPFVGSLFGSVKSLFKHESEYRTEIKQVLRRYPGTLLRSVNELFDAANELLHLVFQSALLASGDVILEADVERAMAMRKQELRDMINANGWLQALLTIHQTKQITDDEKSLRVLFHYLAFKYNGDGWYDVHPLIAEIPEFERGRRGTDR
jgi:hypothetical protein